jgi:hypothetical protein
MRNVRAIILITIVFAIPACERTGETASSARVQRDTIGDTIVVRNLGRGDDGDTLALVETLRIGKADGGTEYGFGNIGRMAVAPDGTIYVYDGALKLLRAYDSAGKFIRSIGRQGAGPGEFNDVVALVTLPDGRIVLRDPSQARISFFDSSGKFLKSWTVGMMTFTDDLLRTDSAGNLYLKSWWGEPTPDGQLGGFVRLDSSGKERDTLAAPFVPSGGMAFYSPSLHWTMNSHASFVSGYSARYVFDVQPRSGEKLLRVEGPTGDPIPVPLGERQLLDRISAEMVKNPSVRKGTKSTPTPSTKPAFRELLVAADDRTWVRVPVPSEQRAGVEVDSTKPVSRQPSPWAETKRVWDIFEPDGTWIGRLTTPSSIEMMFMRGQYVWGKSEDENGVASLIRWRIEPRSKAK